MSLLKDKEKEKDVGWANNAFFAHYWHSVSRR